MDEMDDMNKGTEGTGTDAPRKPGITALSAFAYWFKAAFFGLLGAVAGITALALAVTFVHGGVCAVAQTLARTLEIL